MNRIPYPGNLRFVSFISWSYLYITHSFGALTPSFFHGFWDSKGIRYSPKKIQLLVRARIFCWSSSFSFSANTWRFTKSPRMRLIGVLRLCLWCIWCWPWSYKVFTWVVPLPSNTVDGRIPANHLGSIKPCKYSSGMNYQPQLVQDFFHQRSDHKHHHNHHVFWRCDTFLSSTTITDYWEVGQPRFSA